MILSAIAAKLKRRSKDDFKGSHFEAGPSRPFLRIRNIRSVTPAAINC